MKSVRPSTVVDKRYIRLVSMALFFSPYTLIGFRHVGIPELLIVILFIWLVLRGDLRLHLTRGHVFTIFWSLFLALSSVGLLYNYLFRHTPSGSVPSTVFDLMSYLFVLLACFAVETVFAKSEAWSDIHRVFTGVYLSSSIALLILYIVGTFTDSIFGSPIIYYGSFRPFAENIHHVSMFIAPLPFLGVKIVSHERRYLRKAILLGLIASNVLVGLQTNSTKIYLAWVVGFVVSMLIGLLNQLRGRHVRFVMFLLVGIIVVAGALLSSDFIITHLTSFFSEKDIGGVRGILYSQGLAKAWASPIVGLGPGSHLEYPSGVLVDAHQTVLTVFLQAGLLGVLAYTYLMIKVGLECLKDASLFGAFTAITVYSLGGDIMRRLPMWLFLVLFYHYCVGERFPGVPAHRKTP